jgi:acetoin utilization protein AcuC
MGLIGHGAASVAVPEKASRDVVEKFHTAEYLDAIKAAEQGDLPPSAFAMGLGTPDCPVFKGMYDYAMLAAGATLTGAGMLSEGKAQIAFNPSGGYHHARPSQAAGFCYINDVVLGCMMLAERGKKVLFLDLDVHHCDGVQDAFYSRDDVMTVSLHEDGRTLFPGTGFARETGKGRGEGFTVNVPLPVGTYDGAYQHAFTAVADPLIDAYDPDVIVLEIGMDGLTGDPLAHLHLTNNVYATLVGRIVKRGKPLLVTGGGGYNFDNTVRGWALVWSVLTGQESSQADMALGMGGVMLETTDWVGGLRDRVYLSDAGKRTEVDTQVEKTIEKVTGKVFPVHGIG